MLIKTKTTQALIAMLILVLCSAGCFAFTFENEVIESDLTSFKWCFDNIYEADTAMYKDLVVPYVSPNTGCEDVTIKVIAEEPVLTNKEVCTPKTKEECITTLIKGDSKNGTVDKNTTTCSTVPDGQTCTLKPITIIEQYDLKKTDYLLSDKTRLCVYGSRKAKTGFQSCDMNFNYNDPVQPFSAEAEGKLWWDNVWNKKYLITVNAVTSQPSNPIKLTFNTSFLPNCGLSGDIRIVNSTETGTPAFNLSYYNASGFGIYINQSILNINRTYWLYCNASTPQTTTSVSLPESLLLTDSMYYYYNQSNSGLTVMDDIYNNGDLYGGAGWVFNVTGIVLNAVFSGGSSTFKNVSGAVSFSKGDKITINAWMNTTLATNQGLINIGTDNTNAIYFTMTRTGAGNSVKCYGEKLGVSVVCSTPTAAVSSGWHMYTCVWDGQGTGNVNMSLYADGSYVGSCTGDCTTCGDNNDISIGGDRLDGTLFSGSFDEISISKKQLSAVEISNLYYSNVGNSWPFYATPSVIFGSEVNNIELSNIQIGIVNISYLNTSGVNENADFKIWANYSYSVNGSSIGNVLGSCIYNLSGMATNANMTWNASAQLWYSNSWLNNSAHGTYELNVSCYDGSEIENKTSTTSFTINNIAPSLSFVYIADWLNGQVSPFINGQEMFYPLVSTINTSVLCSDDDNDAFAINLSYENTTYIFGHTGFGSPGVQAWVQSNFSTLPGYLNGSLGYRINVFCNDTAGGSVSGNRLFYATNQKPTSSWLNASGGLYSYAPTFSYSCADREGIAMTGYVVYNGSTMATNSPVNNGSSVSYNTAGFGTGTYTIGIICGDAYANSTNTTITWTYSSVCLPQITGLVNAKRYIGLDHEITLNCTNGLSLSSCYWGTNDYALNEITPCNSSFNVSLENGRNDLIFITTNSGINATIEMRVWAKNPDSNVFGFVLFWIFFGLYIFCILMAVKTGLGVLYLISLAPAVFLGLEIVSISWYAGAAAMLLLCLTSILLLVFKNK